MSNEGVLCFRMAKVINLVFLRRYYVKSRLYILFVFTELGDNIVGKGLFGVALCLVPSFALKNKSCVISDFERGFHNNLKSFWVVVKCNASVCKLWAPCTEPGTGLVRRGRASAEKPVPRTQQSRGASRPVRAYFPIFNTTSPPAPASRKNLRSLTNWVPAFPSQ